MNSVLFISGWAHGAEAVQPMADVFSGDFAVKILTGAQVLSDRHIPDADYIITGSMGGLLAMELLPPSCRKLVLVSSTAKFCAGDGYECGAQEKILKRMIVQFKRDPDAVLEEFFKNVHFPHKPSRRGFQPRCDGTEDLVAGLEYLLASDVRAKVPAIGIPVLLLHGTEDRIIPPSASEWLHAHLADSQLKIFGNDGHALPAHHFAPVMREIRAFLDPDIG